MVKMNAKEKVDIAVFKERFINFEKRHDEHLNEIRSMFKTHLVNCDNRHNCVSTELKTTNTKINSLNINFAKLNTKFHVVGIFIIFISGLLGNLMSIINFFKR